MIIQLNTDNNLTIHAEYNDKLSALLSEKLNHFKQHITRLEVHLSDENSSKASVNDKRCLIEARLEGRQPIAVTEIADTYDKAVAGASEKLKSSLDSIIGRLKEH